MMWAGQSRKICTYEYPIIHASDWRTVHDIAADIGNKAFKALLEEVYTTPKPGLVDLYSCGAHRDMDIHTFEESAKALRPYFVLMARQGLTMTCAADELFRQIRITGMAAEAAMYRATGNVNTHKGLIFTLGIFCAAAGRCMQKDRKITEQGIRSIQREMTAKTLIEEVRQLKGRKAASHGEENLKKYGTMGVRGEAILGYPSVWNHALPVLRQGVQVKRDYNQVKLQALFVLMSKTEDSNILARQDPETLRAVQNEASEFLKRGGAYAEDAEQILRRMDRDYIQKNISAGGCADLLATAIFMHLILDAS